MKDTVVSFFYVTRGGVLVAVGPIVDCVDHTTDELMPDITRDQAKKVSAIYPMVEYTVTAVSILGCSDDLTGAVKNYFKRNNIGGLLS